ncbi:MAG: hypothetical protein WCF72_17510 [Pseudolabrys sp.]
MIMSLQVSVIFADTCGAFVNTHHGWSWADESENFELTGVIKTAQAVQRMGGRQRACCGLQRQPR